MNKLWVKVDSAREMYQSAIGAHPDQSDYLCSFEHNPSYIRCPQFHAVCYQTVIMHLSENRGRLLV